MDPRLGKPRTGFTLIELLTVMSIIALLAGILLPSILAAQQVAWQAKCAANLHNMGQVLQAFATGTRGYYPARSVKSPMRVTVEWKEWFHLGKLRRL